MSFPRDTNSGVTVNFPPENGLIRHGVIHAESGTKNLPEDVDEQEHRPTDGGGKPHLNQRTCSV